MNAVATRLFVGVDLAADPRRTGLATLCEDGDAVRIDDVRVGASDDDVLAAVVPAAKAGVDVPFGWPRQFVDLVGGHHSGDLAVPEDTGPEWRRDVLYRRTDLEVRRLVGKTPLSVAADKIAYPAIRWTVIAARLREQGIPTPLDGTGITCEVYPGAALAAWGFGSVRYKKATGAQVRGELVEALGALWPWLDWAGHQGLCATTDDALDAVIAAVVAREVFRGRAVSPSAELTAAAADEGWIWLPTPR